MLLAQARSESPSIRPIRLRTANLVLHLRPVRYANEEERVEFQTGSCRNTITDSRCHLYLL